MYYAIATKVAYLVRFLVESFQRRILCDLFDRHPWETVATGYTKSYGFTSQNPALKRHVLRTRVLDCPRCDRSRTVVDRAPLLADWQNPERLFDEKGALHPAEPFEATAGEESSPYRYRN